MQSRSKLPQEALCQRLEILVPGGVLSIRPHDTENDNSHLVRNPIVLNGMLIDWDVSKGAIPTLEQINSITDRQILEKEESDRKASRNDKYSKDLTVLAAYEIEKKSNPDLVFSDYLDQLEQLSR